MRTLLTLVLLLPPLTATLAQESPIVILEEERLDMESPTLVVVDGQVRVIDSDQPPVIPPPPAQVGAATYAVIGSPGGPYRLVRGGSDSETQVLFEGERRSVTALLVHDDSLFWVAFGYTDEQCFEDFLGCSENPDLGTEWICTGPNVVLYRLRVPSEDGHSAP